MSFEDEIQQIVSDGRQNGIVSPDENEKVLERK